LPGEEKTEKATPKKRRDERKKGHVPVSKDAVAVATLFGGIFALRLTVPAILSGMERMLDLCMAQIAQNVDLTAVESQLWLECVIAVAETLGPLILIVVLMGIVATMAQTRMLVTTEPLKPKFERINPGKGFKRLFSLNSVIEALKGILKISILLYLVYSCLADMIAVSQRYMYADLTGACTHLFEAVFSMLLKVGGAFLVIAAADFGYQWWDYERQMKMTKQEIKEEYKQTEGDPQVKSKIKQIQRQMAQSRMMQQVPGADVVVRNPTHFAVALRYHPGEDDAPVVLAKGKDYLAQRIVDTAQKHNISIVENVPLARALYAQAELNQQIPPDLYEGVAEVMVYLFKLGKLKGRSEKTGAPKQ